MEIARLLEVMAALRDPERGCPWDRAQTFETVAPYTLEEAYEVVDAIERGDLDEGLREELGDLLFQVVFHARMAEEQGRFAFGDVVAAIVDKLVRRHPHVFGRAEVRDAEAQSLAWEAHKAAEREARARAEGRAPSVLDGVSTALPALTRAVKLQRRAARVGFDWASPEPVLAKVREEVAELEHELRADAPRGRLEHEIGDLIMACANLARHLGVDPEAAVRKANARFERRFRAVEAALAARGRRPEEATLEEMDALWNEAKAAEGD
ncbi:MAG TPA: nucleoside triphosphate pyrophosphohydrolase, partial [Chromatiales bacterium]|nr:nucleoside triphosphate pyrophosphohydrolase [Chromatiales bacterium]